MATVGGLSASTSSSIRGYGGLASGLDRDTLIEGMTSGTTAKIAKQEQEQQKLEWKQEAIQNISNQMIDFANKYISSWSSNSNLFSDMLWGRNNITTTGDNSKYVSVSGTASSAEGVTIMGVQQLAQNAKWSSAAGISNQILSTGTLDITSTFDIQQLIGKDIDFKIGDGADAKTYTLTLKEEETVNGQTVKYDYSTPENARKAIEDQLKLIEIDSGNLSNYVEIGLKDVVDDDGNPTGDKLFTFTSNTSNNLEITGGTALKYLGFEEGMTHKFTSSANTVEAKEEAKVNLLDRVDYTRMLDGKSLTFSYNGKTADIKMPGKDAFSAVTFDPDDEESVKDATKEALNIIKNSMQEQLNAAFGSRRIKVEIGEDNNLTFKTIQPEGGDDNTSTLTLTAGNSDVKYVLGLQNGMSNRVNMSEQLGNRAGLFDNAEEEQVMDADGNVVQDENGKDVTRKYVTIKINDATIQVYEDDTMNSLIGKINSSNAGVTVSYQQTADKFTFTAKEDGASGSIKIAGDEITEALFGITKDSKVDATGKDAIVAVKYAGSDDPVELIRGTNSFTVDGLTINVKGTFGYEGKDLIDDPTSAVEISAQVNADAIVDAVKSMVEDYNSLIALVNKELTTRPDSDYAPLTSDQKSELSESEIETWEKKAKEGMLYADSDIRNLSMDLRFIIDGGIAQELSEMGLSTSSSYSDNGKLVFDEAKFRAALASNPERVQELFANSSVENTNKNGFSKGIATNLKTVMEKYANTTGAMESKGILIRKAGSESSPMSVTENTIYKQLAEIKEKIAKLQTQLETERDRYISQFTSLETLISQMNSQSSWLSQLGGF